jgi:hypothetical protein
MAILSVWVDPTRPDDTGDGLSLVNAKKTIPAGLVVLNTGDKGSTCNLVNSADHDWPATGSETILTNGAGTDFSTDPGYTIRGTTSAGVPAKTTVKAQAAGGKRIIRLNAGSGYNIIENIIFDATSQQADANAYNIVRLGSATAGPITIRYCEVLGATTGLVSAGERALVEAVLAPNDAFRIYYTYFQNCRNPLGSVANYGATTLTTSMYRCVGIWDADGRATPWYNQGTWTGSAANDVKLYNNTLYESVGAAATTPIFSYDPSAAADVEVVDSYNNLIWQETSGTVNPFMAATSKAAGVVHTGTLNNNVLLGGPSVGSGDLTADGWYQGAWDANDDDTTPPDEQANDTVAYGKADTDVFTDVTSTYAWELPNGLTTTILKDLRPKQYQTAGRFGSVPGALPATGTGEMDERDTVPFIDVLPVTGPVMRLNMNTLLKTVQNRIRHNALRKDVESQAWREYATRRYSLAPADNVDIIAGIETGEFLVMESDVAVQVAAGTITDQFLPAATVVAIIGGNFTSAQVKNSGAATAETLITVVD